MGKRYFLPEFKTNTPEEKEYNENVLNALEGLLKNINKRKNYNGVRDTCIHIASRILKNKFSDQDAKKLGENIYQTIKKRGSISYSNIIELANAGIELIEDIRPARSSANKSLNELFKKLSEKEVPSNKLSHLLALLSKALMTKLDESEAEYVELLDQFEKLIT
ncbi:hypothetical protein [Paenibacillus sp. NRS-1760]|uniref:hypothetical protein n=1 Tax=Paenibacillus sp. NRS-1760 TaxID=3233902 RepID=UPI003D2CDB76